MERNRIEYSFRQVFRLAVPVSLFLLSGCSDSTSPGDNECPAETASVNATVTTAGSVVFDWSPRCAVALVLIEEDADDQWLVSSMNDTETLETSENRLLPPITYGQSPANATEVSAAVPLVPGHTYELVLWRVLPAGSSTAQCLQHFDNACLVAVKEFTR